MSTWLQRRAPVAVLLAALAYDLSPIDLVPDLVPLLGIADDVGVSGLAVLMLAVWWRGRHPSVAVAPAPVEAAGC